MNPGANKIVAQFSGDGANDAPSISSAVTVTLPASSQKLVTLNPTSLTADAAILNGTVNPQNLPGSAFFEYGTDSSFSSYNSSNWQSVVANSTPQPFSASLTGLASGTTYYCRIVFHNDNNSTYSYGSILSFKTLP